MKRYGDNLPGNFEIERVNEHSEKVQAMFGGCGVRYEMLDYMKPVDIAPRKRIPLKILSLFKFGQKNQTKEIE